MQPAENSPHATQPAASSPPEAGHGWDQQTKDSSKTRDRNNLLSALVEPPTLNLLNPNVWYCQNRQTRLRTKKELYDSMLV